MAAVVTAASVMAASALDHVSHSVMLLLQEDTTDHTDAVAVIALTIIAVDAAANSC